MTKLNFLFKSGFLLVLIFNLCISCSQESKKITTETSSFYTIPFAEIIKDQHEVKLSEIATDVEIIQFENIPDALLGDVEDIELTKDFIFVKFWQHPVLQFSHEGKFIRNIGTRGNGPGEYATCIKMSIDEASEQVYVYTGEYSIMVFKFDGAYIQTYTFPALTNFMSFWIGGRDSTLVSYFEPFMGNEPYVFVEYDEKGDTVQAVENHVFWETKGEFGSISPFFGKQNFSYRFDGRLHLKGAYNDTVYTYNENNRFVPEYYIDLGTHKLPEDLIYERKRTRPVPNDLIWTGVHETSDYIFIPYGYHYDIEKMDLRNENQGCVLYNKKTKQGIAVKETKEGGFADDIAGAPDFRPITANDNTALMLVSALDMKQYLNSDQFKNMEVKFPEEKEQLKKLGKTLTENDNHFVVLVEMKN